MHVHSLSKENVVDASVLEQPAKKSTLRQRESYLNAEKAVSIYAKTEHVRFKCLTQLFFWSCEPD